MQQEPFYMRLTRLRKKQGLSVSAIAREINVPLSTYREWEYGRAIKGEPYPDLARVLRVSINELLTGSAASTSEIMERAAALKRVCEELEMLVRSLG